MPWGGSLESGGGGGGGPNPPVVSNFSPSGGTPITATTPLDFDVTAVNGLVACVIIVNYAQSNTSEVAFDRDGFTGNYAPQGNFAGSSRTTIVNGFHFTLRRRGGWYSAPTIKAEGADALGNPITQ